MKSAPFLLLAWERIRLVHTREYSASVAFVLLVFQRYRRARITMHLVAAENGLIASLISEWFQFAVSDTFRCRAAGLYVELPVVVHCFVCPRGAVDSSAFSANLSHFSGTIREKKVNCSQAFGSLSSRHLPPQCG